MKFGFAALRMLNGAFGSPNQVHRTRSVKTDQSVQSELLTKLVDARQRSVCAGRASWNRTYSEAEMDTGDSIGSSDPL